MTEMPLRDVPRRLACLAEAVEALNEPLARVVGMFMGAGWTTAEDELDVISSGYVAVEQALTSWRMELQHPAPEQEDEDG